MGEEASIPEGRYPVTALGRQGDGIARTPEGRELFVPLALPGDTIEVDAAGGVRRIDGATADRQAPPCRHFGTCGGCLAQHMGHAVYADWKVQLVRDAFRQHGFADVPLRALVETGTGQRRRAVLTAERRGSRTVLGYHKRRQHEVFDLEECPVLAPGIVAHVPGLRALVAALAVAEARLTVLAADNGLDVAITADVKRLTPALATAVGAAAQAHGLARVTLNGSPVAQRAQPELTLGPAKITPPPGIFVQAVAGAEDVMRTAVTDALAGCARVADLFCGVGTFSFALARSARVLSVDSDAAAIGALQQALRHTQGLKPVEPLVRDLFRDPLAALELEGIEGVALDPPRAGAEAQARSLVRAKVQRIAYVSCNPATLARDARVLVDGGFALARLTPIDQFVFSDHIETVAIFELSCSRAARGRRS